jgi:hypothetical protein
MDWKLVFMLSLFGLAMGVATVFFIPSNIEPIVWLIVFLFCAYIIGTRRPDKHFWHGLVLGLFNSVWIVLAHVLFFDRYMAGHAREAAMSASGPMPNSPRLMMSLAGPVIGLISGIIIGLFSLAAGKLLRRRQTA